MMGLVSVRDSKHLIAGVALAALLFVPNVGVQADPIRIESGLISGTVVDEESGVRAYKGIPFAAPPVGELRWKPPQPANPWEGVRACTEFGPACSQTDRLGMYGLKLPKTSEDCLHLNVWTAAGSGDDKRPVMVWIHGGGYISGWSSQPSYDGEAFARKGVVLVTINYRLGPFGFFGHPLLSKESEQNVSGNYGMLDQIAALRWVQRNIAAFGGDPDCVTIFGESAGAGSVSFLCLSPLSKGLFHRAITESGSVIWNMTHLRRASPRGESVEATGERLAAMLVGEAAGDVIGALRAIPSDELLAKANPGLGISGNEESIGFGPAVDGWILPDYPAILYQKGMQHDVPLLAGTNADEGTLFTMQTPYKTVEEYRDSMRKLWRQHADDILGLYPAETPDQIRSAMSRYIADSWFVGPTRAMIRAMENVSSRAYLYHFTRVQETGMLKGFGAFHASEIAYVFNTSGSFSGSPEQASETDRRLADGMITYWTQFAKTGDPNVNGLPEWPAYETASDKHLELGDTIRVGSGLHKEACDELDRIMADAFTDLTGP